jgi:hypothetical protein
MPEILTEAATWLTAQPTLANGKVDIRLVIAEGQKRGYCICPIPMSQLVDFRDLGTHRWCGMLYTDDSWTFWWKHD